LVLGVTIVVAVYLLANVAYLRVLGVAGLAASTATRCRHDAGTVGPGGRQDHCGRDRDLDVRS